MILNDIDIEEKRSYRRTTVRDVQVFKQAVEHWTNVYGLMGWQFTVRKEDIPNTAIANFEVYPDARQVLICIGTTLPKTMTLDGVRRMAFHEVTEAWVTSLAIVRGYKRIEEERHNIVHTLEKLIYEAYE